MMELFKIERDLFDRSVCKIKLHVLIPHMAIIQSKLSFSLL